MAEQPATAIEAAQPPPIRVRDLRVRFWTQTGWITAVDGVSFDVQPGEAVGVVGESGSGKSVTALALLGLLPRGIAEVDASVLEIAGVDLPGASPRVVRSLRGARIAMIFQDPVRALTPTRRVGDQLSEVIRAHEHVTRKEADARAIELLELVGIPNSSARARDFPHQFSGGQAQRIMIAIAIACRPDVVIADEPTTALDVTTQSQILEVIDDLRKRLGMAILFISHDFGVVARLSERMLVMYGGRVVEAAPTAELFRQPKHPYTAALLSAVPRLDRPYSPQVARVREGGELVEGGCAYRARCPFVVEQCLVSPPLAHVAPSRQAACWRSEELQLRG